MNSTPPTDPVIVDARGMCCPWPVLRAEKMLRGCAAIRILADDPIAADELRALANLRGWAYAPTGSQEFLIWKQ
jgi:tRNA 2-thiouridine synthesizing protein A